MNFSDSERLSSFLENHQFKLAKKIKQADFVIFNTCGIRQTAEDRVYGQIHNLQKKNPEIRIILTGCLTHRKDVQKRLQDKVDLFCKIKDFQKIILPVISEDRISQQAKRVDGNSSIRDPETYIKNTSLFNSKFKTQNSPYLSITPKYSSNFQANIPIMTGCNNFCSYCVVPYAREKEVSRPVKEIIQEIKKLVNKNYKEITLLGQNVNSYAGKNEQNEIINFSQLLKKINNISGEFWIRFVSSHPKDMSNELIKTVTKLKKVCENIHLPIQSGDNIILKKMNRRYTSSYYLKLIKKIKKSFEKNKPKTIYSISADIIVGFPEETRKQFLASAKIMEKVGYDMVYFGQFSPRPETVAWNMNDNITKKEKVDREKYLNEILKKSSLKNNKKYVGRTFDVLVEKNKDKFYYGKTRTAKNIKIIKNQRNLIGKIIKVKIIKANIWNLEGTIDL